MNDWIIGIIAGFAGFLVGGLLVFFLGIRMRHADMDEILLVLKRYDHNMTIVNTNVRKVGEAILRQSGNKTSVKTEVSDAQKHEHDEMLKQLGLLQQNQAMLSEKLDTIQETEKNLTEVTDSVLTHVKLL